MGLIAAHTSLKSEAEVREIGSVRTGEANAV